MHIAFLSYYSGSVKRGVETYVSQLSKRLVKLGHSVRIYNYQDLKSVGSLPKFDPAPDIVIPTNGRLQAIKARLWCLVNQKKCFISGQSGPGADDKLNLLTFPDAFIGLTTYQCRWAKAFNPLVKVVHISNGVDPEVFSPKARPLSLQIKSPVVIYVAALEPIKRHHLLIDAVFQTSASLLLVGKGSLENEITKACQKKLPGRFQIISASYAQMPNVYASADAAVYPTSPWESFGISILEAMATNLPVVATNDPIRKEIIEKAGFLANPENTTEFANAISLALKKSWGNIPLNQAKKFTWDIVALKYHHLFTKTT
ncbi:hypothetical protein A2397_04995 [Candidatus Amesbacteria bacterium RIFOXYB1_FULL_44_23]|uniref:Glycosyl transferase family 1 domain-containing protein n=1 Tax=Candidatus Amesbacteria bacterium RIFOXYB1_FULL_44_23 TaxID=1797263 RepID=A0A1F4ZRE2_9BACT|nr:MAG: hypothetical protein A2397_04995 [Candidatus Amesbacteria bacterium RIFOXYB1_FULL_44_23]